MYPPLAEHLTFQVELESSVLGVIGISNKSKQGVHTFHVTKNYLIIINVDKNTSFIQSQLYSHP